MDNVELRLKELGNSVRRDPGFELRARQEITARAKGRRALAISVMALVILAVGAGSYVGASVFRRSPDQRDDSFASAVAATKTVGTLRMSIDISGYFESIVRQDFTGSGEALIDFTTDRVSYEMQFSGLFGQDDNSKFESVSDATAVYHRFTGDPFPGDKWVRTVIANQPEQEQVLPFGDAPAVEDILSSVRDVRVVGDEFVAGTETTHYRGWMQPPSAAGTATDIEVNIWIGNDDLIIRKMSWEISRSQEGFMSSYRFTMELEESGPELDIEIPGPGDWVALDDIGDSAPPGDEPPDVTTIRYTLNGTFGVMSQMTVLTCASLPSWATELHVHDKGLVEPLATVSRAAALEIPPYDPDSEPDPNFVCNSTDQGFHLRAVAAYPPRFEVEAHDPVTGRSARSAIEVVLSPSDPQPDATLRRAAYRALADREWEKAEILANKLLKVKGDEDQWEDQRGDALHHGNLILGRIALHRGDVGLAERYLLAAGRTPGSEALNAYGPNMALADALLRRDRSDVVLRYFDLVRQFWNGRGERLDEWAREVKRGKIADFGNQHWYGTT